MEQEIVSDGTGLEEKDSTITGGTLLDILKQQNFRCALSGCELTPENVSSDHKIPLSNGGKHELKNVHLVTRQVNAMKGTMSVEEFVSMCRRVADCSERTQSQA